LIPDLNVAMVLQMSAQELSPTPHRRHAALGSSIFHSPITFQCASAWPGATQTRAPSGHTRGNPYAPLGNWLGNVMHWREPAHSMLVNAADPVRRSHR
jgi:hypothetical protein